VSTQTMPLFALQRCGIVMQADPDDPREAWGVLNPGGTRGPDGSYYLFPRVVAEGNFSRIARARVLFDVHGEPAGVERLGYALEPREPYERNERGGGVEDPRVTYLQSLQIYAMTYTAYAPTQPRIALAVSRDLITWERLGPLRFTTRPGGVDLNACNNKDGAIFPEVVPDPLGRPAVAVIHRPSIALQPAGRGLFEAIWISYIPLEHAVRDIRNLAHVHEHRVLMAPRADWERVKVGAGAPPVRLPYGWLLLYHGVSQGAGGMRRGRRYCAGAAILALDDPLRILYRSAAPILEPEEQHELSGIVPAVVFPTATDLQDAGRLDVYYGAADSVIAAARLTIPVAQPAPG
jgi:beta-1,2-mannobiose phosphorylase / 1,2-beta-oligomannan phosphorylase